MNYYAKLWDCGKNTVLANGHNRVIVYSFGSKNERDAACAEYRAPNHCPTAELEPVTKSDVDVRRALRDQVKLDAGCHGVRGYGITIATSALLDSVVRLQIVSANQSRARRLLRELSDVM